jgi:hypothetical protein
MAGGTGYPGPIWFGKGPDICPGLCFLTDEFMVTRPTNPLEVFPYLIGQAQISR